MGNFPDQSSNFLKAVRQQLAIEYMVIALACTFYFVILEIFQAFPGICLSFLKLHREIRNIELDIIGTLQLILIRLLC